MSNIANIYHIADLHIRSDRRVEYIEVFNELIRALEASNTGRDIAVICGDIFHFMTRYHGPEDITDFCYLIEKISAIMPVVIIPGNHDANLNNKGKSDLISPIYDIIRPYRQNVFYYPKTGVYTHGNIDFCVLSLLDDGTPESLLQMVPRNSNIKIALLHEDINGATFGEFTVKDSRINSEFIKQFHYVLSGHIHDCQFINIEGSTIYNTKPQVAYCGALFQQNLGESLNKGIIKWSLAEFRGEFMRIKNDYGYIKFIVESGNITSPSLTDIPKYPKDILIEYKNTSPDQLKVVIGQINSVYPAFNIKRIIDKSDLVKTNNIFADPTVLQQYDTQETLLSKYMQENKLQEETINKILTIHKGYTDSGHNNIMTPTKSYRWQLVSMEWSNLFCYGENNIIDFTKLPDRTITGIIANNRAGKTSIIDILIYGLFNKLYRGDVKHIMRNGSKYYYIKITFKVLDKVYVIERRCIGASNPTINFTCDGSNLNEENMIITYQKIADIIGSYDDFVNTNIMCQDNTTDFVKLNAVDRRRLLTKIFQLDSWVDAEVKVKKELQVLNKTIKAIIPNDYNVDNFDANVVRSLEHSLEQTDKSIQGLTVKKDELFKELAEYQSQKETLLKQLVYNCEITNDTYADRKRELDVIRTKGVPKQSIAELQELYTKKCTELKNVKAGESITNFDEIYDKYNASKSDIESHKYFSKPRDELAELYKTHKSMIAEYNKTTTSLTDELDKIQKKKYAVDLGATNTAISLLELQKHTNPICELQYSQECNHCTRNKSIIDRDGGIQKIEDELSELFALKVDKERTLSYYQQEEARVRMLIQQTAEKCKESSAIVDDLINFNADLGRYNQLKDLVDKSEDIKVNNKVKSQLTFINELIQSLTRYTNLKNQIEIYEKNHEIKRKIAEVNSKITAVEESIGKISREVLLITEHRGKFDSKISSLKDILQKVQDMKSQQELLEHYNDCIDSKNGIPFKILSNVIFTLEKEVNDFLQQITDFRIAFQQKNKLKESSELKVFIVSNTDPIGVPLDLGSGFQKFVISIVVRIVLSKIFPTQLSNFIIIDEGFSCIDAQNINNVQQFLQKIRNYFGFVMIISHLDTMQNMIETPLSIDIRNNISYMRNIEYTYDEAAEVAADLAANMIAMEAAEDTKKATPKEKAAMVMCEVCNCEISKSYLSRHNKSKKHMDNLAKK